MDDDPKSDIEKIHHFIMIQKASWSGGLSVYVCLKCGLKVYSNEDSPKSNTKNCEEYLIMKLLRT